MTWDGSTSGEPYFWQTSESEYRCTGPDDSLDEAQPYYCDCCRRFVGDETMRFDGAFDGPGRGGWVCAVCDVDTWLERTNKRRAMDFGGMETR